MQRCPHIEDLFVSPPNRNRKIGEKLIKKCIYLAKEKKFNQIGLGVEESNKKAKGLYSRFNFIDKIVERDTLTENMEKDGQLSKMVETDPKTVEMFLPTTQNQEKLTAGVLLSYLTYVYLGMKWDYYDDMCKIYKQHGNRGHKLKP